MLEYIPSVGSKNPAKFAAVMRGPEPGEISAMAQKATGIGHQTVYTVFAPSETITAEWCADFAHKATAAANETIARVEVKKLNGDMVVFWVEHNCLRVYRGCDSVRECIYENNNGVICHDTSALMDSGCGNPYAFYWRAPRPKPMAIRHVC